MNHQEMFVMRMRRHRMRAGVSIDTVQRIQIARKRK
jgi:hypothetical protein